MYSKLEYNSPPYKRLPTMTDGHSEAYYCTGTEMQSYILYKLADGL